MTTTGIFSPGQLAALVATIPDDLAARGHRNAVLGTVDAQGAQIVARVRMAGDHLEFRGAWTHTWTGDDAVGTSLLLSW